jgi:RNA polymerase sigma-70 factor (sigma-E family)
VTASRDTFDAFVVGSSTRLLRFAYLLVGDRAHAEDLLQEVLERMYVGWRRIDDPNAYAHRAITRRAQNRWRARQRRPEVAWGERDIGVEGPDLEARDALMRALAELPHGQRAVVVLRYLHDLTTEQTAHALGCSVGTVKSQTARALPRLRALLELAEENH